MKLLLLSVGFAAISCCSSKKTTTAAVGNESKEEKTEAKKDESTFNAEKGSPVADSVPVCIRDLIAGFKAEEVQNPPRKVYSYTYNGHTVYYVPAICCDFFSDLYDDKCNVIGHPDGGFTGRGDGKVPDFEKLKSNEKLIWQDTRKQ